MRRLCVSSLCTMLLLISLAVCAAPSKQLQTMLNTQLPGRTMEQEGGVDSCVKSFVRRAWIECLGAEPHFHLAVEHPGHGDKTCSKVDLPAGTLRQQLDKATSYWGYTWEANGDWINLYPKERVGDSTYPMNCVIPGKVVVSRVSARDTEIRRYLPNCRMEISDEIIRFSFADGRNSRPSGQIAHAEPPLPEPDTVVLQNPTYRQYCNVHEELYGRNSWHVTTKMVPGRKDGGTPNLWVLTWPQVPPPPKSTKVATAPSQDAQAKSSD